MEFRILGPLEVRLRGRPVPLGGPKQRAVLGMLLLHANEVVPTERLIDELWGERPPRTVDAYVQNCVSRLRKTLGRERVETHSPGYLLRVGADELDAVRFERALEAAQGLEPAERASALREALALWRGPPLADLAFESFAQGEIARLDELRLTAHEDRLAAELELGWHVKVLPEIEALVSRQPTRERLRGLQMLALHRSQRTLDALQAYQEIRLLLVEEYGIEPGEELHKIYRSIIEGSEAPAASEPTAAPHPTRRTIAVLVAELLGPVSDDPELERSRTAAWLAEATVAVERHGGELRQLLGEEVVAVFGLPAAHEDDVLRALRAAADLRAATPEVQQRLAVESSELIVGEDAEELANAVTVPRALKEDGAPGDTLLGPAALRVVSAAVDVVPHESGRGFRVLRFDPAAAPFTRRFDAPLIGRDEELRGLLAALDEVAGSGHPRLVLVTGDPGIGKTRLASELVTRVRRRARVLTGTCVAYGEGATFLPLTEVLEQVGSLERALAAEPDGDRVTARLRDRALAEQSEAFWAVRRLLEALARERPVVLLLEDVHWAEPTFLDLVEYVAGWSQAPLLLLCLARPELLDARPDWREGAIALAPLSSSETRELATALPDAARLEEAGVEAAVDAAEGNPLFLEQLLAFGAEGEAGAVPPTVEGLIASRLDRLPPGERTVLDRAAVAGREFWRSAVEALTPSEEREEAGRDLMALVRRRLVRAEQAALPEEDGFRFHHVLIRDVAYGSIPGAERVGLHERLARWLDARGPDQDELVGYHLEQAVLLRAAGGDESPALADEAGRRLGEAGMRALKRVDGRAAVNLLTRATALLPDDGARLELEWALGTAVKFTGDAIRADALLDEVAERARERGDRGVELKARLEQAWPRLARGAVSVDATLALAREAYALFGSTGDDRGAGRASHLEANVNATYLLKFANGEAATRRTVEHYRRSGFAIDVGYAALAVCACRGPTPVREAIRRSEELLAAAETPLWQSFILPSLALLEAMAGQFERARTYLEEAREGRREYADTSSLQTSWSEVSAEVELLAGDPGRAESILIPSCEALRAAGDPEWLATNAALLAEALYQQDRAAEALALVQEALAVAPPHHLVSRAIGDRVLAKALARLGRVEEAETVALELVQVLEATDALDERAAAQAALGEVHTAKGVARQADQAFQRALSLLAEKGNVAGAARLRARIPALT